MTAARRNPQLFGVRLLALAASLYAGAASADGLIIDKIYDPYVQPLEKELEFRTLFQADDDIEEIQRHSLGFGSAIGQRWFAELYAIALKSEGESLHVDTFELEFKRQLTEQGEYPVDWGLLFELEREADVNSWELTTSLLAARDFGRWTALANFDFIYEWGEHIANEFETAAHLQVRHRTSEAAEPGVEVHVGQDTFAVGPVVTGLARFGGSRKIRWSAGYFAGLGSTTPDHTARVFFEYEFL